ncbi:MAG: hypothetical protein J6P90_01050 [Rikenellaceae bacterium]|nr:hypothetical protein [Rikenellaceae bacterium]
MNKWVIYLLGVISGIAFTIVLSLILSNSANTNNNGATFFEQPGDCLSTRSFEIMQVIEDGAALAQEIDKVRSSYNTYTNLLVLIINEDGQLYYDDQVIDIPDGQCARQVGVYKYPTQSGLEKTVPIVMIME